jgi:hypothetical protein
LGTHKHVEIAAMKAEVSDAELGKVLVALLGSASNYRGRKPVSDELTEIPSDVDLALRHPRALLCGGCQYPGALEAH